MNQSMLGVALDRDSWDCGDLNLAALDACAARWAWYGHTAPDEISTRISNAAVVVTNKVVLDATLLQAAPKLKLVCIAATGTNNVDLAAAKSLGITVCNVAGYATPSVVQHTFALLLALVTRLPDYQRAVRDGRWQRSPHFCLLEYPIWELAGKTLGIVGYGTLGRAVAEVARAFGMQVLIAARPAGATEPGRVALPVLLPQVDVLSLHCPLTPETRGLIGAEELRLLRPHALLINTARGGIVDEEALAAALRAGRLGGAGVDVFAAEPPRAGNPLLAGDIPNLIVTPHIAWASREARQRLMNEVAANIQAYFAGQPRNVV